MSRIYDALKKLEAESQKSTGGDGNGHGNGHGNGKNGGGNGHGRRGWRPWPFRRNAGKPRPAPVAIDFNLGPEVEDAYQRLGTNLLLAPGQLDASHPRLLGVVASRHGEGTTTTAGVFASILVRRRGGRVVVVEGNLHSPSFETSFGVKPTPGLVDIIQGEATVAEVAQATSVPNLFAVAGGHSAVTPASLFDSPGSSGSLRAACASSLTSSSSISRRSTCTAMLSSSGPISTRPSSSSKPMRRASPTWSARAGRSSVPAFASRARC